MAHEHGGAIIGDILQKRGVRFLFTLCGGHISPLLVGAKARGVRIIDVRDEKNAVFAADAVARMTGTVGVAAVTAGPGVTNTITAVKNAEMAQSPLVLFGGAAATLLKGRGSLQDIDQISLMKPITKMAVSVRTVAALGPTVEKAFDLAASGVPGPVFIEVPVDLLYPEEMVKGIFMKELGSKGGDDFMTKALEVGVRGYLFRQFHVPHINLELPFPKRDEAPRAPSEVKKAAAALSKAERPVLVIGSQALVNCQDPERIATAVKRIGIPTFLGGMARGLLGAESDLQLRHKRGAALKKADVVVIAGFPFDFRMSYGRGFARKSTIVAANLSQVDLRKNRRPEIAAQMHPGEFLVDVADALDGRRIGNAAWLDALRESERTRDAEIALQARAAGELVNPIAFFQRLEKKLSDDSVLVVDGGDFVATAAYTLRPRSPLSWLDPGAFGTLGVGGGFAVGAALCRPGAEVWLIYGDGSSAYSLSEFDTCVRHGLAPIAVIGSDGAWAQIAREQVEMLGDDVGTVLRRSDYQDVAAGYGAKGLLLRDPAKIDETLDEAKKLAKAGTPVCLNVHIGASDFRKGSISM